MAFGELLMGAAIHSRSWRGGRRRGCSGVVVVSAIGLCLAVSFGSVVN